MAIGNGQSTSGSKDLEEVLNRSAATQQPSLFDFARKKREVILAASK
ncbi:MAG TPA: hypothetical protein VF791_21400 [Pyrinomonadaceae bacterium]